MCSLCDYNDGGICVRINRIFFSSLDASINSAADPMKKDKKQFASWVDAYSDALYQWAYFKTSSKEVAEDLVQETFLAAYKSLGKFEGKSSPRSWLSSILNNKIVDHYRSSGKKTTSLDAMQENDALQATDDYFDSGQQWKSPTLPSFWENEEHLLNDANFLDVFDECIEDLPNNWSLIVADRFIQDKKSKEICQEFDISSSNYWQIIHRSKLLLKKCIELNWNS